MVATPASGPTMSYNSPDLQHRRADDAVRTQTRPTRFFLYFAAGACHSPHQPPARWREHYLGRFDLGWDAWREQIFARQVSSGLLPPSTVLSARPSWELYRVADDLSETRDLARDRPELLDALIELWWREARGNQVLPLDNRALWALVHPKPDRRKPRSVCRYFPGGAPVPESVAMNTRNRSHALVVDVRLTDPWRTDGVLLAMGSALGGWSLHVLDGQVRYVHNLYGKERHVVSSGSVLEVGDHRIEYEFVKDEGLAGSGSCGATASRWGAR